MARDSWYRLDNVGKFYSSQAGSSAQTVFRYAATLGDEVDEGALQRALEKTVEVFPNFNVCLRSGMFWHYLEQSAQPPVATRENLPICFGLHVHAKSILFRVSYYRCRINLEVSHIVSDGRGTLSFFKALLQAYVQERYDVEGAPLEYDGSDHQKSEDSFDKYFERDKAAPTFVPNVYRLTGWKDPADPTFLEYHLPVQRVLNLARSHNVTLTSLVIAAIICAIRTEMPRRDRQRAIRMDVPVDLRRIFESATTKNFFGLAYVTYVPGDSDEPLEVVAAHVQNQLKEAVQAESLKLRMNRMVALEKNLALRFAPLFVKDIGLEIADWAASRETTTTVSSLGAIELDADVAAHVHDVNVLTSTTGLNFMVCSFGDDLSIGISTVFSNLGIVKNFCRYFSSEGIEGHINTNKTGRGGAL
ncbi:MAG: alcohol acetyltransferase [Gordonibacter sp.]|nr:alcohol acetyltransferase [Gordonibacter sp.]